MRRGSRSSLLPACSATERDIVLVSRSINDFLAGATGAWYKSHAASASA